MAERRLLPRYSVSVTQLNNDLVAVPLCGLFFPLKNVSNASLKNFRACDKLRVVQRRQTLRQASMLARRLLPRYSIKGIMKPGVVRLFFSVEVVDEREDETADGADELHPVMNLHTRHLLPSRKKPTHRTACREKLYNGFRKLSRKNQTAQVS